MVLNTSSTPVQETPNAAAGSAQTGAYGESPSFPTLHPLMRQSPDAQAHVPGFGPWMRGRGHHMRGMNHPLFRQETVSLEGGGEGFNRGHHHPHPHHHHHTPPPPPESGAHPDPPLASMPSFNRGSPMGEFGGPGLANLMGHHSRAFLGDLANHFGAPPAPGEGFGPGSPNPRELFGGFGGGFGGGFRGRGGRGGRGGFGGFGGWRGRFPHGGHFPHREFDLPRMDIYQADNTYTVTVELPGLQKQSVDISINEGLLTISGEYPSSSGAPAPEDPFDEYDYMADEGEEVEMEAPEYTPEQGNGGHYIIHERPSGKFKRTIRLPSWVDIESIKATMADGLLTVVFEKPQPQAPTPSIRKVSIA